MKNKHLLIAVFLFSVQIIYSQKSPFFKSYDWGNNPSYNIKKEKANEAMVAVKEKVVTEFFFENNSLVEYFLEHKVLWLNSDERIEEYNKVYLPYSSNSSLEINKARVITQEGKIINLDESKILTANDEETQRKYKYFAFEGITKGSFIEYIYVVKKQPSYRGKKLFLQSSYEKEIIEFDLFSPKNLIFDFKSYNGIPQIVKDTVNKEKLHWKLSVKGLKKIEKENLSAYKASKGSIVYKLDRNIATKTSDISSYKRVSQNIYKFYYKKYGKKTIKLINSLISQLKLQGDEDQESLVRKIDFYIKNNFFTSNVSSQELENLDDILEKKVMNEIGTVKLYVALLKSLNIKHEIVVTSDRRETKFDNKFEANNFLTHILLYFPKMKLYLSPSDFETRFGFPDAYKMDNYGLFVKEVKIADYKSAIGRIKYIKPIESNKTVDKMIINVDFNKENLSENFIRLDRSFSGYYAMAIQPFIHLIDGDKKNELIDGIAEGISKEIEVKKRKLVNDNPTLFGIKPIQFIVDFSSEAFVEKAGKKYLFKLGELIGAQMQMYQEKERVLPVEEQFQRTYYRTITVNIPKGYKITNLDDINIENTFSENGKELFSFKSFFELTGSKLKITADEFYRKNIINVSLYEKYRKVINSAADFNKIVLLLEPTTD